VSERELIKLIEETKQGLRFKVIVKSEEKEEKLLLEGRDLVFTTPEVDVAGRLNAALKRFLVKIGFPQNRIEITYGCKKKTKIIEVKDMSKEDALKLLLDYFRSMHKSQSNIYES